MSKFEAFLSLHSCTVGKKMNALAVFFVTTFHKRRKYIKNLTSVKTFTETIELCHQKTAQKKLLEEKHMLQSRTNEKFHQKLVDECP